MLEQETFDELAEIAGLRAALQVASIQTLVRSCEVEFRHLEKPGTFSNDIVGRFAEIHYQEPDGAGAQALELLHACEDYERRCAMQGLGGCEEKTLSELIEPLMERYRELYPEDTRSSAPRL